MALMPTESTTVQNDKAVPKKAYHYLEVQRACIADNMEEVVGSLYITTDPNTRPIDISLSHVDSVRRYYVYDPYKMATINGPTPIRNSGRLCLQGDAMRRPMRDPFETTEYLGKHLFRVER